MRIDRWFGTVSSVSPYALPPGAAVRQNNLQIQRTGELVPRPGMEAVYTAKDYDEIIGVYRVSNGGSVSDTLIVASKPDPTTTQIRYLSPVPPETRTSGLSPRFTPPRHLPPKARPSARTVTAAFTAFSGTVSHPSS